jgi:hypothetical protein
MKFRGKGHTAAVQHGRGTGVDGWNSFLSAKYTGNDLVQRLTDKHIIRLQDDISGVQVLSM